MILSVVVPAFNEEALIGANLEHLVDRLDASGRSFEVLVVDDGSTDRTAAIVGEAANRDARVRLLAHDRNRGKGRALETGSLAANGDIVVLLDADLEIPAREVIPLVERLEASDVALVVGSKYGDGRRIEWPLHRRVLSRVYQAVTSVLFRLPLSDTQTGIKAMRRDVALELVPHLRSRRFAWDLEFVLLAHKAGHRAESAPVHLEPTSRASRVGWVGAAQAALDTAVIFIRDRWLAGYASVRPRPTPPATRVIVSGDDLGLSTSVNLGLSLGVDASALTSVSVLTTGPAVADGLDALVPHADVGLHADLYGPARLSSWLVRTLGGILARDVEDRVAEQAAALEAQGRAPSHADAHRHAYFPPWVRRRFLRALRARGVGAVRSLQPLGPMPTGLDALKYLVLLGASVFSRGQARGLGLTEPDGFVDATEAAEWVAKGRLPAYTQGRTVEVIGHPTVGGADLPTHEAGGIDRAAETRAVLEPPLGPALAALGADVVGFGAWIDEVRDDIERTRRRV